METLSKYTLSIWLDSDCQDPRENDNVGVIINCSPKYAFGDINDPEPDMDIFGKDAVILPLYAYVHSGMALSLSPFSCPWDSGQIGFAVLCEKGAELAGLPWNEETRARAHEILSAEVTELSAYIGGECYGWTLEDEDGDMVESIGGYIGPDGRTRAEAEALASIGTALDA